MTTYSRSSRPHPRPLARLVGVGTGLLVVLALVLAGLAPATARAGDPTKDVPRLPKACVGNGELISQEPGICLLRPYRAARPTAVIWGDSHAWQYIPALRVAAEGRNVNLVAFTMGGCPPLRVGPRPRGGFETSCQQSNFEALQFVRKLTREKRSFTVFLGSNWRGFRHGYDELKNGDVTGCRNDKECAFVEKMVRLSHRGTPALFPVLARLKAPVNVIGQTATVPFDLDCPQGNEPFVCNLTRQQAIPDEGKTRQWLRQQMRPLTNRPRLIDVNSAYCNARTCYSVHPRTGIYTFYDDLHLSATRSRTLAHFFR